MAVKTEQLITWGLLALIAYELWPQSSGMPKSPSLDPNIPIWVQQLSKAEDQDLSVLLADNSNISDHILDNLLAIPQGPGGSQPDVIPSDYFYQTGLFCR